ncbi:MAG: cysteine dioxygenase family protein [Planctomycetota bacterium]|nr:cysteine dioxygenase family protein [Planctomycetota bacterium]
MTLDGFVDALEGYRGVVPIVELTALLERLEVTAGDVAHAMRFGDHEYRRTLLTAGDAYELLVGCWKSGQRSPIHDHRGSSCGVKVLQGRATEVTFSRDASGRLVEGKARELGEGDVCGAFDRDIHELGNRFPGDLVTLHVSTPPLKTVGVYERESTRVVDWKASRGITTKD